MKKFLYIFVSFVIILISVVPCFAVYPATSQFKNYIELADFYIVFPSNYVEYINFTDDEYLYLDSSSNVSALIYNKTTPTYSTVLNFNNFLVSSTNSNILMDIDYYYNNRVYYSVGNTRIYPFSNNPIHKTDIINSDIVPRVSSDIWVKLIFVFVFCSCLLNFYYIFSKKPNRGI